ncbi:hypothetical protein NX801_21515 [Streptomyces sp. LP05-1]|uniref:Integral membrane protein n=1 Tax=Streptomyces pyxinae TaxID=2970734 RepID=A0ABT2CL93_9ACTN|nr:hypothetical protein [Streptomyces sp. LP05-1]MCS0638185.1 hypothetical protein [Streptomyces sp. LP05-1]
MHATTASTAPAGRAARFLDSPVVGMSPWIVFSLLVGPGRYELSVGLALALAVLLVVAGRIRDHGGTWKILEVSDVVFFAALAVIGVFASAGTHAWLETYAGEVSNIALTLIAFGSMAVRLPFTLQYARESTDPAHWHAPAFLRANYVITGVWGLAFLVAAIAGAYGDLVLRNPHNLWTGWIIQIVAIILALRFTEWYREVLRARRGGGEEPPVRALLAPVVGVLIPLGIVVLAFDAAATWAGVVLIVLGVVLARALRHDAAFAGEERRRSGRRLR